MRVLLDANVPKRLKREIVGHEVWTAREQRLNELANGRLIEALVVGNFDVLITLDKGLPRQQNLTDKPVAILVLRSPSNRIADLLPLVPQILEALTVVRPGDICDIREPS